MQLTATVTQIILWYSETAISILCLAS
uniref:Uncharacterized protein n=1 Tax=Anguilla anguilla TaxID=7936 RepID=A0A0E9TBH1_ANGAN